MKDGRQYWVENGKFGQLLPTQCANGAADERLRLRQGQVRLTTGDLGTEIKWTVLSPCNASLFAITVLLRDLARPYILRFYASGWFEEFYDDTREAAIRIEQIIARGDRHFVCNTIVKQFEIDKAPLSPLLRGCMEGAATTRDYAVECVFEETSRQFHVEKIGQRSAISRVYGTFLSSYPCRSVGSYSDTVSKAYTEVMSSGRARYDQILSAMCLPNNDVQWVPYARLILPNNTSQKPSVLVVSEIGKVEIQVI